MTVRSSLVSGFASSMISRRDLKRLQEDSSHHACRCRPIHPDSRRRAFVDVLALVVLLYDSIMIPYQVAWNIPMEGWFGAVSWGTSLFWVVDLVLGFFTGFYQGQTVVMDFRSISLHYLRRSFFFNFVITATDIAGNILVVVGEDEGITTQKTLIRLARFIKLNRIVRLSWMLIHGRVAQAVDVAATYMRSWGLHEGFNVFAKVFRLLFTIMWVNHIGCCMWRMVGSSATEQFFEEVDIGEEGRDVQYVIGFWWSVSAMIVGEAIMTPTTMAELVTTVLVLVFGFLFSSVLISSLLTAVLDYQDSQKEQYERLRKMRQFLSQHRVESWLAVPIVKQVNQRMAAMKWLSEGDVDAIGLLSPMLRYELWSYIYRTSLVSMPFLHACSTMDETLIKDIGFYALDHAVHLPGTSIFEAHTEAVGAHVVCWGEFEYVPVTPTVRRSVCASEGSASLGGTEVLAQKGDCISEAALLVPWLHRGWLDATMSSELLTVGRERLVGVVHNHPEMLKIMESYSRALLEAMEREDPDALSDMELPAPHSALLVAMPLEDRIALSSAALNGLSTKQWSGLIGKGDGMAELRAEVNAGVCDLVADDQGKVQRWVAIVALRLVRDDRTVLTQVGKIQHHVRIPFCQPPGTKVQVGEHPQMAVERLIRERMEGLSSGVEVIGHTNDDDDRPSRKYGLSSRYARTLFHGKLRAEHDRSCMEILTRTDEARSDWRFDFEPFVFRAAWARREDPLFIYAWLSPGQVKSLSGARGEAVLQSMLSGLQFDEDNPPVLDEPEDVPEQAQSSPKALPPGPISQEASTASDLPPASARGPSKERPALPRIDSMPMRQSEGDTGQDEEVADGPFAGGASAAAEVLAMLDLIGTPRDGLADWHEVTKRLRPHGP